MASLFKLDCAKGDTWQRIFLQIHVAFKGFGALTWCKTLLMLNNRKQKEERMRKTIKTKGLGGSVLL